MIAGGMSASSRRPMPYLSSGGRAAKNGEAGNLMMNRDNAPQTQSEKAVSEKILESLLLPSRSKWYGIGAEMIEAQQVLS